MRNLFWYILLLLPFFCSCEKHIINEPEDFNYLDSLSVLYWNILEGMSMDKDNDYQNFIYWVHKQNPDVCVWCEGNDNSDGVNRSIEEMCLIWHRIASRYGHDYVYVAGYSYNYPQIVTSKYSLKLIDRIGGSYNSIQAGHGSGWLRIIINGEYYNIVTAHLSSFSGEEADIKRHSEMKNILDYTVNRYYFDKNQNWIMVGDFNSYSIYDMNNTNLSSKNYSTYLVSQLIEDCSPYIDMIASQYPYQFIMSTKKGNRIDYVYATLPINEQVSYIRVIYDDFTTNSEFRYNLNAILPSDHFPIIFRLNLKNKY